MQCIATARQTLDESQGKARVAELGRCLGQQPADPARGGAIKARVMVCASTIRIAGASSGPIFGSSVAAASIKRMLPVATAR